MLRNFKLVDGSKKPFKTTVRYPGFGKPGTALLESMKVFYNDPSTKKPLPVLHPEASLTERTA